MTHLFLFRFLPNESHEHTFTLLPSFLHMKFLSKMEDAEPVIACVLTTIPHDQNTTLAFVCVDSRTQTTHNVHHRLFHSRRGATMSDIDSESEGELIVEDVRHGADERGLKRRRTELTSDARATKYAFSAMDSDEEMNGMDPEDFDEVKLDEDQQAILQVLEGFDGSDDVTVAACLHKDCFKFPLRKNNQYCLMAMCGDEHSAPCVVVMSKGSDVIRSTAIIPAAVYVSPDAKEGYESMMDSFQSEQKKGDRSGSSSALVDEEVPSFRVDRCRQMFRLFRHTGPYFAIVSYDSMRVMMESLNVMAGEKVIVTWSEGYLHLLSCSERSSTRLNIMAITDEMETFENVDAEAPNPLTIFRSDCLKSAIATRSTKEPEEGHPVSITMTVVGAKLKNTHKRDEVIVLRKLTIEVRNNLTKQRTEKYLEETSMDAVDIRNYELVDTLPSRIQKMKVREWSHTVDMVSVKSADLGQETQAMLSIFGIIMRRRIFGGEGAEGVLATKLISNNFDES